MPYYIKNPSQIPLIRRLYSDLHEASVGEPLLYSKYEEQKPLLTALAKSSDSVAHLKLKDILPGFVYRIELPKKETPSPPQSYVCVNTYAEGPYKGQEIHSLQVGGWRCVCDDWYELVLRASEILFYEHEREFEACVLRWIVGPQRGRYFSKTINDFNADQRPRLVGESGIYVATCLTANNSVSLAKTLCTIFGYHNSPVINES